MRSTPARSGVSRVTAMSLGSLLEAVIQAAMALRDCSFARLPAPFDGDFPPRILTII